MSGDGIASTILSILTLLTSVVAIYISIKSIKQQTKSTQLQTSLQLFELRMKVYKYYNDVFYIFDSFKFIINSLNLKMNFQSILDYFKNNSNENVVLVLKEKLKKAEIDDFNCYYTITTLFSQKLSEQLLEIFRQFSEFYNLVNYNTIKSNNHAEKAFTYMINFSKFEEIKKQLEEYLNYSKYKIPSDK